MSDDTHAEQYKHPLQFHFQTVTTHEPFKYLISFKVTLRRTTVATEKSIKMKINTNPNLNTLKKKTPQDLLLF